jgi:hypothetical protein
LTLFLLFGRRHDPRFHRPKIRNLAIWDTIVAALALMAYGWLTMMPIEAALKHQPDIGGVVDRMLFGTVVYRIYEGHFESLSTGVFFDVTLWLLVVALASTVLTILVKSDEKKTVQKTEEHHENQNS